MKKLILLFLFFASYNGLSVIKTWTTIYGAKFGSAGFDVSCDSKNYIYAAGRTLAGFDNQKHTGPFDDACLSKLSSDGKRIWTRIWGTQDEDGCYAAATDNNDNIFVAGYISGSIDNQPYVAEEDCFISKFNSNGERLWTKMFGTELYDYIKCITIDTNGNIYVAGTTYGNFGTFTNQGWQDIFVAKFSPTSELIWLKQFGSARDDTVESIIWNNNNNEILVCGGIGSFDGFVSKGFLDLFLRCYDSDGNEKWTKMWGSSGFDTAYGIAIDTNNNIFVAGWANGSVDGQTYLGEGDFCLTKFNSDGLKEWLKLWGTEQADWLRDIIFIDNKFFVAGTTIGGTSEQNPFGREDIYFAEISSNGSIISERLSGSKERDYAGKLTADSSKNIYLIGETFGSFNGQKNKAIKDAPNIFVSAFNSATNLNITTANGKVKPGKFNAKIFHQIPVEYFFNGAVTVAVNNITNVFSSDDGEWKWNKKGTAGKIKRADKSIMKIKGANPKKRKIILKILDGDFNYITSNLWIGFSNGQSDSTKIISDPKGKF